MPDLTLVEKLRQIAGGTEYDPEMELPASMRNPATWAKLSAICKEAADKIDPPRGPFAGQKGPLIERLLAYARECDDVGGSMVITAADIREAAHKIEAYERRFGKLLSINEARKLYPSADSL